MVMRRQYPYSATAVEAGSEVVTLAPRQVWPDRRPSLSLHEPLGHLITPPSFAREDRQSCGARDDEEDLRYLGRAAFGAHTASVVAPLPEEALVPATELTEPPIAHALAQLVICRTHQAGEPDQKREERRQGGGG